MMMDEQTVYQRFAMKTFVTAISITSCLYTSALAGQCQDDFKTIDTALTTQDITPDQKAQVKDMRNQAEDLCKAGNEQEGLDVLGEAKVMLNVE